MAKIIKLENIKEFKFSVQECPECGEPLDDKHQMRDVLCEDC